MQEYYGIDCKGRFFNQRLDTLPVWAAADEGRFVYDLSRHQLYYGSNRGWEAIPGGIERMDVFPEVLNASGKMALDVSTPGSIVVSPATMWNMRYLTFSTRDFTAGQRTFATQASKTYHLRFVHDVSADGDNIGSAFYTAKAIAANHFYLVQTNDAAYNPDGLLESHTDFDSKFDDILFAKVVTDASNVATATKLVNKRSIMASKEVTCDFAKTNDWAALDGSEVTIDWARKPKISIPSLRVIRTATINLPFGQSPSPEVHGSLIQMGIRENGLSRYGGNLLYVYEDTSDTAGYGEVTWVFQV